MDLDYQKYFKEKILNIRRLDHFGNNLLFKVNTPQKEYLLKRYSVIQKDNWARGETEFFALNHLWRKGFRNIPRPFNFYKQDQIGIYSFEEGITLNPLDVRKKDILEIVNFLSKIHNLPVEDKIKFNLERTSCLSILSLIRLIEERYKNIIEDFIGDEDSKAFLVNKVYPQINELKKALLQKYSKEELSKVLSLGDQVVTPGDFGFHNILVDKLKYTFLDFEYCGRDNPIKQILDFLHHDKSKEINKGLKDLFIKKYLDETFRKTDFEKKLLILDPLIGMNWVLIYLNPFSKKYLEHMKFSQETKGKEDILKERLSKAKLKLDNLNYFK